ncbi:MAG: hypothetical protein NT031_18770 [Planctomycetota bacterium]|nr:hypothetical protein [Planctomycetota bacterium]
MQKIVLISCVKSKAAYKAKAKKLYISPWFKQAYKYALTLEPDRIFILSAKHKLLNPEKKIDPYETTLNTMSSAQIKAWAATVIEQLERRTNLSTDHFIVLASERYRKWLLPHLHSCEVPMRGLTIGRQLHWLNERVPA